MRRLVTLARHMAITSVLLAGVCPIVNAQIQHGTIRGTILDPDGRPIDGAAVRLLDELGETLASAIAVNGTFQLTNVAPGTYALRADAAPLGGIVRRLVVSTAIPVDVELRLSPAVAEEIIVAADRTDAIGATNRVTLAGSTLRRAPTRLRSRALQDAVATAPGWSTEDNGIVHVRGVDDGFLYVVDGVPVYERIDGLFGTAPDPAMVDSVNVISGYIPPEFGLKSGAVIEVRSAARPADSWIGAVDVAAGTERMRDFSSVAGGPLSGKAALTLGLSGQTSSRFLDPVHPDNLHNQGGSLSGGGHAAWHPSPRSTVTAVAGFGRSRFDVPHGDEQEEARQDQRQRTGQHWQTISWQRGWSSSTVSQVAGYHRYGSSDLAGSPRDTPLFSDADRAVRRVGMLASTARQLGPHLVKFGGEAARLTIREDFTFAVTDAEAAVEADLSEAALAHTTQRPFVFNDAASGHLLSVYVQDSIRASARLAIDVGIRADWNRLLAGASQWSPRVGAAYRLPRTDTLLRASIGRFFQPPQVENLLLASSREARELSPFAESAAGGSSLEPERQTAFEAGVEQLFAAGMRVDVSYWRRRIRNVADPNVFFGTTIIVPNAVDRGHASGVDARLELPRRRGWSGYASYSNSRVVQFGPITGGLFLEENVLDIGPGTAFTPDHDQRHAGAAGLMFDHEQSGFAAALSGRYESGTPLEVEPDDHDELRERPGAELVDFDRGRVKPRGVLDARIAKRLVRTRRIEADLRVTILNLTNRAFAFNFGNPFSGTHVGPGRTVQAGARIAFR